MNKEENNDLKIKIGKHADRIVLQQAVIESCRFCIEQIEWGDSTAYSEYRELLAKLDMVKG